MANAVEHHHYVRVLVEALLKGEPEGGSDWRSRLEVPGIMVTDGKSQCDHTMIALQAIKDRGVQVVLGRWQIFAAPEYKRGC